MKRLPERIRDQEIQKLQGPVNVLNGDPPEFGDMGSMTPMKRTVLNYRRQEMAKSPGAVLYRKSLENYVRTWLQADRHFGKWANANPGLWRRLNQVVSTTPHGVFHIDGEWPYVGRLSRAHERARPTRNAIWDFLYIARSPMKGAVGKCLRAKCGKYYLSRWGHANKAYCSRQCTTRESAERSTEKRRRDEHDRKVDKANLWLSRYSLLKNPPADWKAWLSKRSGLTQKWITRTVNRGNIHPPRKNRGG